MKVAIIGSGYVGLVTGVGLAVKGHRVIAVDIDQTRVARIAKGVVPFHEPGVAEALKKYLKAGNLQITSKLDDIVDSEVVLVCVQTPPKKSGAINLGILKKAVRSLATLFSKTPIMRTVVIRSTVIPGTTDKVVTPIFKKVAEKTHIAFNPEFLREGSAMADFLNPDRIVIGTHSKEASKILRKLFILFKAPIIVTTPSTAELSKYTSNIVLATLISFSNEIARICEHSFDADIEDVLNIVHQDRRFKSSVDGATAIGIVSYLKAGCGFGGSCFPKDLSAFIAYASSIGEEPRLLKAVEEVNAGQSTRLVNQISKILNGLDKRVITVLGAAFKGGTDDLRQSPGLHIVDELLKRNALVTIYDPLVAAINLKNYQDRGVTIAPNMKNAVRKAEVLIITSNAPEFHKLNQLNYYNKKAIIVDGRRILKVPKDSKKKYYAVGLSRVS